MRLLSLICVLITLSSSRLLLAQDAYEEWLKQQNIELQKFKDEHDRQFTAFLEKHWAEYKAFQGEKIFQMVKPVEVPEAKTESLDECPDSPVIKDIPPSREKGSFPGLRRKPGEDTQLKPEKRTPDKLSSPAKDTPGQRNLPPSVEFDYFGETLTVAFHSSIKTRLEGTPSNTSIANWWRAISNSEYSQMLVDSRNHKTRLALNDWGYSNLLWRIGKSISGQSENEATLFTWFMLVKAGYDARVAFNQDDVYLLLPSLQNIYGASFIPIGNHRYFVVKFDPARPLPKSFFTYEGKYPGSEKKLDLQLQQHPVLFPNSSHRDLRFCYNGEEMSVPVNYNSSTVQFYQNYPLTDLSVYFSAPLAPDIEADLVNGLTPLIEGRSEADAVNLILRFVQKAFVYQTDDAQFGREKPMFKEETLFYPSCDCEDRAVLFAWLVNRLTGLKVIGLKYPGHVATAVNFSVDPTGESLQYKGEKFTVCDPTYINANIGMAMPKFKGQTAEVIPVKM